MNGEIVFHSNGTLYFKSTYGTEMVPLESLQSHLNLTPSEMVFKFKNTAALLGSGSTIGSFLLCLRPWVKEFAMITDRDLEAYLTELRKPSSVTNQFDRIEIRETTSIRRSMIHRAMEEGQSISDWLNSSGPIKWDNRWSVDNQHTITGYVDGDESNYSVSGNLHTIKNVPLTINRSSLLIHSGSTDMQLMNCVPAAMVYSDSMFAVNAECEKYITWEDLVDVVVCDGLWHNTPQGADNFVKLMESISAGLKGSDEVADENSALHLVDDDADIEEEEEDVLDGGMSIQIAPGAFDGLASSINAEAGEWDETIAAIKKMPGVVVHIGKVSEDVVPDNRMFGKILD